MKVIELWPIETECWACGVHLVGPEHAIPIWEDLVLPNEWSGEWGGVPACLRCFEAQGVLSGPVQVRSFLAAVQSVEAR